MGLTSDPPVLFPGLGPRARSYRVGQDQPSVRPEHAMHLGERAFEVMRLEDVEQAVLRRNVDRRIIDRQRDRARSSEIASD